MTRSHRPAGRDDGQIIVIFALALVAIVAMVGLVLDGASTFAQRRNQQNAADLAALAGANDYLLNGDQGSAVARAKAVTARNGFTDGAPGTTVQVMFDFANGASVTVGISAPHQNAFAGIVGMPTWQVSTTATAITGIPDTASGAAPFIFSVDVFDANGGPKPTYADSDHPFAFNETNGDVPTSVGDIAWTNYGTGNLNTHEVDQIITGALVIDKTLQFGEYIGQHNNGNHTALYPDVQANLAGTNVVVPIVDHGGNFQGWATFHVTSAVGGSAKHIYGYFVTDFLAQNLTVGHCSAGTCPRYFGSYVLKLVN